MRSFFGKEVGIPKEINDNEISEAPVPPQNKGSEKMVETPDTGKVAFLGGDTVLGVQDEGISDTQEERMTYDFLEFLQVGDELETWVEYEDQVTHEFKKTAISLYTIEKQLGEGGMGVVYKARRKNGQEVVLKMIKGEFLNNFDAMRRFEREIRTQIELTQGGMSRSIEPLDIIHVQDPKEGSSETRIALVLPFMKDGNLHTFMNDLEMHENLGKNEEALLVTIGKEISLALAQMHAQGYVHRDIKPENIFVNKRSFHVSLGDFGLTKMISDIKNDTKSDLELAKDYDISQDGIIVGTPEFMSPSALTGLPFEGDTDFDNDLYALGMSLYLFRTHGKNPFIDSNDYLVIAQKKVKEQPKTIKEIMGENYKPLKIDPLIETLINFSVKDRKSVTIDGEVYDLKDAESLAKSFEKFMKHYQLVTPVEEYKNV